MLLLDTNALLWLSGGSAKLGKMARTAVQAAVDNNVAAFSAVSVWEVAMLVRKGRHALGQPVELWRADLLDAGLKEAPLDGAIASLAVGLPDLHDDPADRFIAATSLRLGAQLVTSDRRLIAWARVHAPVRAMDARQ
jgi:PIN domain nuclease of toxin-antitoxin system